MAPRKTQQETDLNPGQLYAGMVYRVDDYTKIIYVLVDGAGTVPYECVYAGGVFSSMFGLQTRFLPSRGTRVLMVHGATNFIVACTPSIGADFVSGKTKTMTGCGLKPDDTEFRKPGQSDKSLDTQSHPYDLLEGELDLSNAMSVGIRLLTGMASLNAGDRAKVETCLLNDMVRVVSETFRHYSAFGNYQIYDDGRLNVRFDGTSYPHEAAGVLGMDDERVKMNGNEADLLQIIGETGRWRFSEYVGFLGDFVTQLVTDPTAAVGDFAENAMRAGKARFHINSDGTMLLQSVTEIVIERVCRIPVPVEKKRPDDPNGNIKDDFADLEAKYLKLWKYGTSRDDMAKTCYQLREYARWLSNYHAYARFHQLDKDWAMPTEDESPAPSWDNQEGDRISQAAQEYIDTYATIRIMRDGSIVTMDGSGSSVVLSNGDVRVSAAKNMYHEAAGDMVFVAGNDIHMKAGRDIAVTAISGSILSRAKTAWKALCDTGVVWLKSDMAAPFYEDGEPDSAEYGVLLDAEYANTMIRSGQKTVVRADGPIATGGVELIANGHVVVRALGQFRIVARKLLAKIASEVVFDVRAFRTTAFAHYLGNNATLKMGNLNLNVITTGLLKAVNGILSPERGSGGLTDHYNHVGVIDDDVAVLAEDALTAAHVAELEELETTTTPEDEIQTRKWNYPAEDAYKLSNGNLFESHAQQKIRLDAAEGYEEMDPADEIPAATPHTGTNAPWPGKSKKKWVHDGGEALDAPSSQAYSDITGEPAQFSKKVQKMRKWKGE